jgi:hypothetical protein
LKPKPTGSTRGRVSIPELRALALYRYMENRSLYLGEGELIVGEKTSGPQKAPTFPELCCHTLDDMRIMDARELISFKVTPDALKAQEETVIPYWKGRSIREKLLASMTQEWRDCYEAGIFTALVNTADMTEFFNDSSKHKNCRTLDFGSRNYSAAALPLHLIHHSLKHFIDSQSR